ncbi:MAG: thiopeptide-type bacteriocin biosynthesis protein [Dysgonamonadaceae bacterium]|jgi:thiopeptide-type bacteriocin biosynthesis protein|nr:thiopeptide-type bacteriocin biosynthesis protein [Dysgonamonadaceae bacterium]
MKNTVQRSFIPGSKWLYLKIYCGVKTADNLLIKELFYAVKEMKKQQLIDKWFFIRYADPDAHLRIRFLLKNEQQTGEVLNLFYKRMHGLLNENQLWKIQTDTYNRELERYGESLIEEAESVFYIDSESTLSILKILANYGNENYRWMIALKLVDSLLADFSLTLQEKQQLMEAVSASFKMEFRFNEHNAKQFNTKFRENKLRIESVLNNTINDENFICLYHPLKNRSKRLIPVIEPIKAKLSKKNQPVRLEDLLKSYIHMMINRLFRSKNRMHELILYDFMRRYYASEAAKSKYNKKILTDTSR